MAFLIWVYHGALSKKKYGFDLRSDFSQVGEVSFRSYIKSVQDHFYTNILPLISLGEKWCQEAFMNKVMDRVQDFVLDTFVVFSPAMIDAIYAGTSEDNKVRRFCAAIVIW